MTKTTNINTISNGGMTMVNAVINAKKEGYDNIRISNYSREEWLSLRKYLRDNHIECMFLNEEYVQQTYIMLSARSIKRWFDMMNDRPVDTSWKEINAFYEGIYTWEKVDICKCISLDTKKHGPIVHTMNKVYVK